MVVGGPPRPLTGLFAQLPPFTLLSDLTRVKNMSAFQFVLPIFRRTPKPTVFSVQIVRGPVGARIDLVVVVPLLKGRVRVASCIPRQEYRARPAVRDRGGVAVGCVAVAVRQALQVFVRVVDVSSEIVGRRIGHIEISSPAFGVLQSVRRVS